MHHNIVYEFFYSMSIFLSVFDLKSSKSMGSKLTNNTTFGSEIPNRKCFVQVFIVDIKKNIYEQNLKCRDNLGFAFVILL